MPTFQPGTWEASSRCGRGRRRCGRGLDVGFGGRIGEILSWRLVAGSRSDHVCRGWTSEKAGSWERMSASKMDVKAMMHAGHRFLLKMASCRWLCRWMPVRSCRYCHRGRPRWKSSPTTAHRHVPGCRGSRLSMNEYRERERSDGSRDSRENEPPTGSYVQKDPKVHHVLDTIL